MKTLAYLALALALTTSAALARDAVTSQGSSAGAPALVAVVDGQVKGEHSDSFVLDNDRWQTYLHWHQEARGILPTVCNGDCAARPTPARISLTHPY